jgi:hypothetical protein
LAGYWLGIDKEHVSAAWAIELLAGRDPVAATERAWLLDEAGLLSMPHAAMAIISGALKEGIQSRDALWPLIQIGAETYEFRGVAQDLVEGLHRDNNDAAPIALKSVSRIIRMRARRDVSDALHEIGEVAAWMQGMGAAAEAATLTAIASALSAEENASASPLDSNAPHWRAKKEDAEPEVVLRASSLLEASARSALETLEQAKPADLAAIKINQLEGLVARLLTALPVGDLGRVAQIVERWGGAGTYHVDDALIALNGILEHASDVPLPDAVRHQVAEAFVHLLNPETVARAAFDWEPSVLTLR